MAPHLRPLIGLSLAQEKCICQDSMWSIPIQKALLLFLSFDLNMKPPLVPVVVLAAVPRFAPYLYNNIPPYSMHLHVSIFTLPLIQLELLR